MGGGVSKGSSGQIKTIVCPLPGNYPPGFIRAAENIPAHVRDKIYVVVNPPRGGWSKLDAISNKNPQWIVDGKSLVAIVDRAICKITMHNHGRGLGNPYM